MESKKIVLGIAILAFILIETTLCKSQRRHNRKPDTETGTSEGAHVDQDVSSNITNSEVVKGQDNPMTVLQTASSAESNVTQTTQDSKKLKKSHRQKHRRTQHKRKQHYKRARKNKKRNESEDTQGHELQMAGLIGNANSENPIPQRERNHHHKKANKHHQRQERRLRRRKKFRAHKKLAEGHSDEINPRADP